MKKHCTAVLIALCAAATLAAQTDTSAVTLLNVGDYSKLFLHGGGRLDGKYSRAVSDNDFEKIASLGGSETRVDTPLEIALLSTCAGAVDVRPVEASAMLGNPRQADLKLGAAVYQEMQMLRFLGNTDAVGRHEGILTFITDRGNVSRAEIEKYLKDGIAEVVDAKFGKVSGFMLDRKYNVELAYNSQTKQYTLSYERPSVENDDKQISVPTLDTLSSAMSRSGDFSATAFNAVREQAALIPVVVLAETGTTDAVLGTVKKALTDFYLSPTIANYNTVKGIFALFRRRAWEYPQDPFFEIINSTYFSTLSELSEPLARKVFSDINQENYAASTLTLTQAQIRALTVPRGGAR